MTFSHPRLVLTQPAGRRCEHCPQAPPHPGRGSQLSTAQTTSPSPISPFRLQSVLGSVCPVRPFHTQDFDCPHFT